MRKILNLVGSVVLFAVLFDLLILVFAIFQLAVEGKTGYWNNFWLLQAKFLFGLLQ